MKRQQWDEFRSTGLLLIINQILHVFGWAIVIEMDGDVVVDASPARVPFRGFATAAQQEAYAKVSRFMQDEAHDLVRESNTVFGRGSELP